MTGIIDAAEIALLARAIARAVVAELTTVAQSPEIIEARPTNAVYNVGPFVIDAAGMKRPSDGEVIEKAREFARLAEFLQNEVAICHA